MSKYIAVILVLAFCCISAEAQSGSSSMLTPRGSATPFHSNGFGYAPGGLGTVPPNNSYNGYGYNPYARGGYFANPYAPTYQGQYNYGGVPVPVYGPPQFIRGNLYGINYGGAPYQFYRAPSGYYYPWVGGYNYGAYPIYYGQSTTSAPSQTLPPISTMISDLNDYLDKSKEKGKINAGDYTSLKRRASDLLTKEKSLTYGQGGVLDSDSESEIRRDVAGLCSEVAHRVRP